MTRMVRRGKTSTIKTEKLRSCLRFNVFLKVPERHIYRLLSVTMDTHCAFDKAKNLLVHVHNKIHQSNLNSF